MGKGSVIHIKLQLIRAFCPRALLCLAILLTGSIAHAQDYDPSASVYRFHQKMAQRGSAQSQQTLGLMYETGSGTQQSILSARMWYEKAAAQNYKPAINRLTYLQIQQSGFTDKHSQWLKNLKNDANFNEGEALFLLGQMYSEGTGVNKNLDKSLVLLRKAVSGNIPGSETQIAKVKKELTTLQKQHARAKKTPRKTPLKTNRKTTKVIALKKAPPANPGVLNTHPREAGAAQKTTPAKRAVKNNRSGVPVAYKTSASKAQPIKQDVSVKNQHSRTNTDDLPIVKATPAHEPVTEKKEEAHPMDTICGGRNRFSRGCRQH